MTSMYWQSALLLGFAYFAGCCLACMLRRMMSDAPQARGVSDSVLATTAPVERQSVPKAVPQPYPAALAPAPAHAPPVAVVKPVSAQPVAAPAREAFRRADSLEPAAAPAAARVPQFEQTNPRSDPT